MVGCNSGFFLTLGTVYVGLCVSTFCWLVYLQFLVDLLVQIGIFGIHSKCAPSQRGLNRVGLGFE